MEPQQIVEISCPYCGEALEVLVDCSVATQRYVEDCQVCCRPIDLSVRVDGHGAVTVEARREDD